MIATQKEIPLLREGGKRLARILETLGKAAVPGVSTDALNTLAEKLIRENGDTPSLIGYTPRGADRPYPDQQHLASRDKKSARGCRSTQGSPDAH